MPEFNVMEHHLVPEHHLLSKDEEKAVLKKYNIRKEQLPKIRKEDPAIRFLERIEGDIPTGRVIKVIRKSEISGVAESYRVIV